MSNLLKDPLIQPKIEEILGETVSDTWLDIAWDTLINALGYDPSFGEATDEKDGTGDNILYLIKRPIKEIKEIIINTKIKELTEFKIYKEIGIKFLKGCFYRGMDQCSYNTMKRHILTDEIEVTYDGGYTAEEFPNDLILASASLLQVAQGQTDGESSLKSYKISDIAYSFKDFAETSEFFSRILDKYRIQ